MGDMEFGKMQIVNLLAAFHGHTSLLEISTGTTGQRFSEIDHALFHRAERLTYNLQGSDDGQPSFTSTAIKPRGATLPSWISK